MKVLITYMSLTGNTKKVAEAIFEEIQDEKEIKELREVENFEGILGKCKDPACEANLLGTFDCQGELDENLAQKLLNHPDPTMQKFGAMREMTIGHPDPNEIESARAFAKEIMEKVRTI